MWGPLAIRRTSLCRSIHRGNFARIDSPQEYASSCELFGEQLRGFGADVVLTQHVDGVRAGTRRLDDLLVRVANKMDEAEVPQRLQRAQGRRKPEVRVGQKLRD